MAEPTIPANELADLFRAASRGEVPVVLMPGQRPWKEKFSGNVTFRIGEYRVTFFNDCGELDYTDSATAPDGRECSDWDEGSQGIYCPLDMLTAQEQDALEKIVENAA